MIYGICKRAIFKRFTCVHIILQRFCRRRQYIRIQTFSPRMLHACSNSGPEVGVLVRTGFATGRHLGALVFVLHVHHILRRAPIGCRFSCATFGSRIARRNQRR